jgi:hypothetical protein
VAEHTGQAPMVLDAEDLVRDPDAAVRAFCAAVGVPHVPESLRWQPGDRSEWAPTARWHRDVSRSAGFTATPVRTVDDNPVLRSYLECHLPHYERLHALRLRVVPERAACPGLGSA